MLCFTGAKQEMVKTRADSTKELDDLTLKLRGISLLSEN
jgi:hypothetical protein